MGTWPATLRGRNLMEEQVEQGEGIGPRQRTNMSDTRLSRQAMGRDGHRPSILGNEQSWPIGKDRCKKAALPETRADADHGS